MTNGHRRAPRIVKGDEHGSDGVKEERKMDCPICGEKLPHITALLARTQVGTQCPNCWARLRGLEPRPLVLEGKKIVGQERPLGRAA